MRRSSYLETSLRLLEKRLDEIESWGDLRLRRFELHEIKRQLTILREMRRKYGTF